MVLDTGTLMSGLSERKLSELRSADLAVATGRSFRGSPYFRIENASIEGRTVPPIEVLLSPSATRFEIDGILGLSFLRQFRRVSFDVDEMRLTLTPRS
jgi:hypothetical protein